MKGYKREDSCASTTETQTVLDRWSAVEYIELNYGMIQSHINEL